MGMDYDIQFSAALLQFAKNILRPYQKWCAIYLLCAIISGTYGTILWHLTKVVIDQLTLQNSATDLDHKNLILPVCLFCINYFVHGLCWRGIAWSLSKSIPSIVTDIIRKTFSYAHKQNYQFFIMHASGNISHNIITLASQFENVFSMILSHIIRGSVQLILAIITVYFVHPIFSLLIFIWVIAFCSASLILTQRTRQLATHSSAGMADISAHVVDSLTNAQSVQIFAQSEHESTLLEPKLIDWKIKSQKTRRFQNKMNFIFVVILFVFISIVFLSLTFLKLRQKISIGEFSFTLGLCIFISENITWVTMQIDQLQDSIGKIQQSLRAIFTHQQQRDELKALTSTRLNGDIRFEDVHFAYANRPKLFKGLTVTIPAGQRVGLVGFSGGGKTTFVHLLLRLFDLDNSAESGRIVIDGQDIKHYSLESLRKAIAFVPQDCIMFHRSLRDNILFASPDATEAQIIEASRAAQIHDTIMAFPEGYETLVGERGVRLSGGQRQRLGIARAILKNASIIILDEATSQLDSLTEKSIQESLDHLMHNKTCLVVAHRLSTLKKMDRILVFREGSIVEDGTHTKLIEHNSYYAALWHAQVDGFLPHEKLMNDIDSFNVSSIVNSPENIPHEV